MVQEAHIRLKGKIISCNAKYILQFYWIERYNVVQLMWTPVDAISQRNMVPGNCNPTSTPGSSDIRNLNGAYAYKKIIKMDETKGLYRGFGISIITYAPSNMAWWASYPVAWCWARSGVTYARRMLRAVKMASLLRRNQFKGHSDCSRVVCSHGWWLFCFDHYAS